MCSVGIVRAIYVSLTQVPAVELLLNYGVNAKAKTHDDMTILGMIACTAQRFVIVIMPELVTSQ